LLKVRLAPPYAVLNSQTERVVRSGGADLKHTKTETKSDGRFFL
jgi:hypothetical protein